MQVCVVDYGSGNLRSAAKALERALTEADIPGKVTVSARRQDISNADRIVLPGVGAYADCQSGIRDIEGLWQDLDTAVQTQAKPLLGICVGMQLMADWGREFGDTPGFGWVSGEVTHLEPADPSLKIPHMGWNNLTIPEQPHRILDGIMNNAHAYFVHSYSFKCQDPSDRLATVDHGETITAVIGRDNVVGTQFHPEKSQAVGLKLLTNFLTWTP